MTKATINNNYNNSNARNLWDVYDTFSNAKAKAFERCKELMYRDNGSDMRITSHNCNVFTACYEYADKGTGVVMLAYITPSNVYRVERAF